MRLMRALTAAVLLAQVVACAPYAIEPATAPARPAPAAPAPPTVAPAPAPHTTAPPPSTPAPASPSQSAARDQCGAAAQQRLVGRPRSEIPVPLDPSRQRVACTTCPVTMDYRPDRLNFFYDAETGVIREVRCG